MIALCRQSVPNLKGTSIDGVFRGAYTISDAEDGKPQLILVGTGSELHICAQAAVELKGVKVIQSISYP